MDQGIARSQIMWYCQKKNMEQFSPKQNNHDSAEAMKASLDQSMVDTLRRLRTRAEQKPNLFAESEQKEFDRKKDFFPEEYEFLLKDDAERAAFDALTPDQKRQVLFKRTNNGMDRPENPIIHHLDD